MDEVFDAGNIVCASGFDVVLRGMDTENLKPETVAARLCDFVNAAKRARDRVFPALKDAEKLSDEEFRAALPNYCGVE